MSGALADGSSLAEMESRSELNEELAQAEKELQASLGAQHPLSNNSATLRRFLVARKLNISDAVAMIEKNTAWRAETLPVKVTPAVRAELQKGKFYVHGHDAQKRPLMIIRSGKFDPKTRDLSAAVDSVVQTLESEVNKLDAEVAAGTRDSAASFAVFYDRTGFSVRKNWDLDFLKGIAGTLSDHYPERLGGAYVYPCGMVLAGLWKMISPFFDPRTRAKVKMVTSEAQLRSLVPPEFLPKEYGGTSTYVFDPEAVPPATHVEAVPVDID